MARRRSGATNDSARAAPVGFAVRVGKKASMYLVEARVAGKNIKIHAGLARVRKGAEAVIDLATAHEKAWELVAFAKLHGANPKADADRVEASELTMGQIWDRYLKDHNGGLHPAVPAVGHARGRMPHVQMARPTHGGGGRHRALDRHGQQVAHVAEAKNRGDHEFPIGPCAFELLKLRLALDPKGSPWVFPAQFRNPRREVEHYNDPTTALNTVRDRAGPWPRRSDISRFGRASGGPRCLECSCGKNLPNPSERHA